MHLPETQQNRWFLRALMSGSTEVRTTYKKMAKVLFKKPGFLIPTGALARSTGGTRVEKA